MIWSFSEYRTFKRCQRQWYFKTEVANARAKSDHLRREAYLLSKLQSVYAWRGAVVDHVISEEIIPALEKGRRIDYNDVLNYAKSMFDTQLSFAKRHGLREPHMSVTEIGDSFAAFYAVEYGSGITDQEVAQAWIDVQTALTNFLQMQDLLNMLKEATRLIPQRVLVFTHCRTNVRAVPDLIAFFKDAPALIVDWKVHTFGTQDYRLQLACYALALTRCNPHKDFPPTLSKYRSADVRLLEVQLLTNQQRSYRLSDSDIETTETIIAVSSDQIQLALGGKAYGQLSPFDFTTTDDPEVCQRCQFRSLCWEAPKWQDLKQMSLL